MNPIRSQTSSAMLVNESEIKTLQYLFPSSEKLINFLVDKEFLDIAKIFKSIDSKNKVNFEKLINTIVNLISGYTITGNQLAFCRELIKLHFPNQNSEKIDSAFNKITQELTPIDHNEFLFLYFNKLEKLIDFLSFKDVVTINKVFKTEDKIEKFLDSIENLINKYNIHTALQLHPTEWDLCYELIKMNFSSIKNNSRLELFNKKIENRLYTNILTKYQSPVNSKDLRLATLEAMKILFNNLVVGRINPKSKFQVKLNFFNEMTQLSVKEKEFAKLLKKFSNVKEYSPDINKLFKDQLNKLDYKPNHLDKNCYPLLYKYYEIMKNSNNIGEEFKRAESLKEDLVSYRTYFKYVQNLFSNLAFSEAAILTTDAQKHHKKIELIMKISQLRVMLYPKFPSSFYKNLSKYPDLIQRDAKSRYDLLMSKINRHPDPDRLFGTIIYHELESMRLSQELSDCFFAIKNKDGNLELSDKDELNMRIKNIQYLAKDVSFYHKELFKDDNEFACNFLPLDLIVNKILKLKKIESDSSYTTLIHRLQEINLLYRKNFDSQDKLHTAFRESLALPPLGTDNSNLISPIYKKFPVEEILTAHIQGKKFIDITSENKDLFPNESSIRPKIKTLHPSKILSKENKNKQKSENKDSCKKPALQYFNTLKQAVKVTSFGKTELLPQSTLTLFSPQKKQLDYLSSEFHNHSPLPGQSPSWSSEHERVSRWREANPTLPLPSDKFPEYPDRDNHEIQRFYHTIPEIAHRFIENLGTKQKIVTETQSSEHPYIKKKRTTYTAIAKLSQIQQTDDYSYSSIGTPIDGFYGIGISKGVLFHDAFSTQTPDGRLARSQRTITPTRFEDKRFCVDIYDNGKKIYKVSIDDKKLMKRLEIFRTKRVSHVGTAKK